MTDKFKVRKTTRNEEQLISNIVSEINKRSLSVKSKSKESQELKANKKLGLSNYSKISGVNSSSSYTVKNVCSAVPDELRPP